MASALDVVHPEGKSKEGKGDLKIGVEI